VILTLKGTRHVDISIDIYGRGVLAYLRENWKVVRKNWQGIARVFPDNGSRDIR
jgi:hypothetical protein